MGLADLARCFLYPASAVPKLAGEAEVAANFERWGYPGWFLLFIGVVELIGGLGLLLPKTAGWAASGLVLVMLGAVWTHISHNDGAFVFMPILFLVLLSVVAVLRWPLRAKS